MVAGLELSEYPAIQPRQKAEPNRLALKRWKQPRGRVCGQSNPRIEASPLRWNPASATTRAKRQEPQEPLAFKSAGIIIADGTLRSRYDEQATCRLMCPH